MRDDPAMGNLGYERQSSDYYPTPAWCTEALLRELPKGRADERVWEPACGDGRMSEVLIQKYHVISTDLVDRGYSPGGVDFLAQTEMQGNSSHIVTNPPYEMAEEFLRHALALTKPHSGLVAFLLRNEFDSAKTRRDLFANPPFWKKLVLTKRPRWFEGEGASPRHNYSWFIWDWSHQGDAVIKYSGV